MPYATIAVGVLVLIVGGSLHRKLNRIKAMFTNIDEAIAGLTQQVGELTSVDQSAEALLSGLSVQLMKALDELKQQGVTAAQLASLQSLADAMGTQASGLAAAVSANTVSAGDAPETITAPAGDDTIAAASGDDTISTGAGQDTTTGALGADTTIAPTGDDTIDAGTGNDTLDAGAGADTTSA